MMTAATRRDPAETLFAKPAISADRRADGSIILKSTTPLKESARCVGDWLEHWARLTPQRIFLADRASAGAPWQTVSYADALRQVRAGPERETAAGDPVRQQRRSCAVRAGGPACRRALGGDLAGVFADVQRLRQAQGHDPTARARRDLR